MSLVKRPLPPNGHSSDNGTSIDSVSGAYDYTMKIRDNSADPLSRTNSNFSVRTTSTRKGLFGRIKPIDFTVVYLNGSKNLFTVDTNSRGDSLLNLVCEALAITESEYFGLTYFGNLHMNHWLKLDQSITKQVGKKGDVELEFHVRFYPPDTKVFHDAITSYYLSLQIQQDLITGKLPASFYVYAYLGAYLMQSEVGDFNETEHGNLKYLATFTFAPADVSPEPLHKAIADIHRRHTGMTREEANRKYLSNALKLAAYGMELYDCTQSLSVHFCALHGLSNHHILLSLTCCQVNLAIDSLEFIHQCEFLGEGATAIMEDSVVKSVCFDPVPGQANWPVSTKLITNP
ncbi:erythrocyte membrane protein band 4.1-like [Cichlidogyrus casuarinus]|uniref:Erythrocyte membrane protein band 4.1-like n=1 Tax=Cichlidogyrus casuarinus TaxID=1844966 RepID=A0ABD2Q6D9_9PLAT